MFPESAVTEPFRETEKESTVPLTEVRAGNLSRRLARDAFSPLRARSRDGTFPGANAAVARP